MVADYEMHTDYLLKLCLRRNIKSSCNGEKWEEIAIKIKKKSLAEHKELKKAKGI